MLNGKLVTYVHMGFRTSEVSDRPVFVNGGPAHGTCCIILCDIFFHFVSDYEISAVQRGHERFFVFTVVLLKIQVLWDVMLCHWPNTLLYPRRFQSSDKNILNYVTTYKTWKITVVRQYYSQMKNNLVMCGQISISALDILSRYVSRGMWALLPHRVGWSWMILYPWLAVQGVICWTQPGDVQCPQTSPLHLGLSYMRFCMWHWLGCDTVHWKSNKKTHFGVIVNSIAAQ